MIVITCLTLTGLSGVIGLIWLVRAQTRLGEILLQRSEEAVSYHESGIYTRTPDTILYEGNPDIRTCATDLLIAELQNRTLCSIVAYVAQKPGKRGRTIRCTTMDFSGDILMAQGLTDRFNTFMSLNTDNVRNNLPSFYSRDDDDLPPPPIPVEKP